MASVLEHEQHDHDNDEDRAHDGAVTDTEIPEDSQSCTVGKGLEERDCEEVKIDSNRKEDDLEGTGEDEGEDKHDDKTTAAASDEMQDENSEANKKLQKMGLNTALAIGLHNFPEGLATFVAALKDPAVGAVLAVAIAIHNIPEGENYRGEIC
jgi:zinc transporter ZupT